MSPSHLYSRLRTLPLHQRRAAKARLDRGEGLYGKSVFRNEFEHYLPPEDREEKESTQGVFTVVDPDTPLEAALKLLGLDANPTPAEAKKAYHRRAKETHPDQGGTNEEFRRVREAYEVVLSSIS